MLERDAQKPLSGNVEIDDAYWGGKKKGGKRGRGSENKTPFLAAVEKNADNHPILMACTGLQALRRLGLSILRLLLVIAGI